MAKVSVFEIHLTFAPPFSLSFVLLCFCILVIFVCVKKTGVELRKKSGGLPYNVAMLMQSLALALNLTMAMASWWLSEHLYKRTKHVHKQSFCSQFSLTKTYQSLSTVVVQCFSPLETSTSYWIFLRWQFDPRRWCETWKFGINWMTAKFDTKSFMFHFPISQAKPFGIPFTVIIVSKSVNTLIAIARCSREWL